MRRRRMLHQHPAAVMARQGGRPGTREVSRLSITRPAPKHAPGDARLRNRVPALTWRYPTSGPFDEPDIESVPEINDCQSRHAVDGFPSPCRRQHVAVRIHWRTRRPAAIVPAIERVGPRRGWDSRGPRIAAIP
jgi:hypothetical protein